jgi:hypothetical protein
LGPPGAFTPINWGAQVNYDLWTDTYTPDEGVALHHGGGSDYPAGNPPYSLEREMTQLRRWEAYHLNKGWRGLAYGWAIGQTGQVYRARGWGTYGAHLGDIDGDGISNNKEIIPIIFIGSGNHHHLSANAQFQLHNLRAWILTHAPGSDYLYGHKEVQTKPTACPGPNLMEYVRNNRRLADPEDDMPFLSEEAQKFYEANYREAVEELDPMTNKDMLHTVVDHTRKDHDYLTEETGDARYVRKGRPVVIRGVD